jgi:hypothetical protein
VEDVERVMTGTTRYEMPLTSLSFSS